MGLKVYNDAMRGRTVIANTETALDTGGTTSVVIQRREQGQTDWVTIKIIVVLSLPDLEFSVGDIYARPHKTYEYKVTKYAGKVVQSSEEFTIESKFDGIMVATLSEQYVCILNPQFDYTMHYNMNYVQPMFSKYPKSIQNGNMCYATGNVSGLFLPMTENDLTLENEYEYKRGVLDFLTNGEVKFIKTYDGHMWMAQIDSAPQEAINQFEAASEIKFAWTEVADVPITGAVENNLSGLDIILQPSIKTALRIDVLESDMVKIGEIQGGVVDISLTINSQSDVRSTCNMSMLVETGEEFIGENLYSLGMNWYGKVIRVYYGIWDTVRGYYAWYLQGTFIFDSASTTIEYSSANKLLTFRTVTDLMGYFTQQQIGTETEVEAGSNMKEAIIATVNRYGAYGDGQVEVCDFDDTVPYDIELSETATVHGLLKTMIDVFPFHQHYYDRLGKYIASEIPMALAEPCVLSANQMQQILISETQEDRLSDVRNATELWGHKFEFLDNNPINYTAESCVSTNGIYVLTVDEDYGVLENGHMFFFTPDVNSAHGQQMRIQTLPAYGIYTENGLGEYTAVGNKEMKGGIQYVVRYAAAEEKFVLLGQSEIHVICMEYSTVPDDGTVAALKAFHGCNNIKFIINPESPYACDKIGCVKNVLIGGDYSNIYSTVLAYERASYENWKTTRQNDTLLLKCLYVPWLDVNQKVEYSPLSAKGVTHQYTVQSITVNQDFTMNLTLRRFYNVYPWLKGFAVTYNDAEQFTNNELSQYTWDELGGE